MINEFVFVGPDHIAIFLSPKPQVEVVNWSFIDTVPPDPYIWNGRPTYFIMYGFGLMPSAPYSFWIDVTSENENNPLLDIVVTGQYVHHEKTRTKEYTDFLNKFPSWTHKTAWITSYHAWIY